MTRNYRMLVLPVGRLGANCYILIDQATNQTAVIDPGGEGKKIAAALSQEQAELVYIINTHGHWDHIGGNKELQALVKAPLLIHSLDAPMLGQAGLNLGREFGGDADGGRADQLLADGDTLVLGGLTLEVIHTPGHTPGGICLLCEDLLFTGDTLFRFSVGRSDLPGGDEQALLQSLATKLRPLNPALRVLPGHGPESLLSQELEYNPFFPRAGANKEI